MNFKQNDTKALRSKSLLNEIESVYDEVRRLGRDLTPSLQSPCLAVGTGVLKAAACWTLPWASLLCRWIFRFV